MSSRCQSVILRRPIYATIDNSSIRFQTRPALHGQAPPLPWFLLRRTKGCCSKSDDLFTSMHKDHHCRRQPVSHPFLLLVGIGADGETDYAHVSEPQVPDVAANVRDLLSIEKDVPCVAVRGRPQNFFCASPSPVISAIPMARSAQDEMLPCRKDTRY